jgi:TPR repeat protein
MKKIFIGILLLLLISGCANKSQFIYLKAQDELENHEYFQGIESMYEAASLGSLEAQRSLGDMLTYPPKSLIIGRILDFEDQEVEAAKWYEKAADQGDEISKYELALILMRESYAHWDLDTALTLLESLAKEEYLPAHAMLTSYYKRLGMTHLMMTWIKKAVLLGHPASQFELAMHYKFGGAADQDFEKYMELLTLAAANNHPKAQYWLSNLYLSGEGVSVDHKKSFDWVQKSALQGHPAAMYNYAYNYDEGRGVEQDLDKAFFWYQNALKAGIKEARIPIRQLINQGVPIPIIVK